MLGEEEKEQRTAGGGGGGGDYAEVQRGVTSVLNLKLTMWTFRKH